MNLDVPAYEKVNMAIVKDPMWTEGRDKDHFTHFKGGKCQIMPRKSIKTMGSIFGRLDIFLFSHLEAPWVEKSARIASKGLELTV